MGKKTLNIILICFVIGLWATLGYRFLNNFNHNSSEGMLATVSSSPITKINRDTFELKPLERDPFLNREGIPKHFVSRSSFKKTIMAVKTPKQIIFTDWPVIEYYGYIKSGKNKELALVKINGKLQRLHTGEMNDNILLKNIYKDSIAVVFNKNKKIILKH